MTKDIEKKRFFFQGKYFDNEEDFFGYVTEWPLFKTDEITMNRLFENLMRDLKLNLHIREIEINNLQLLEVLNTGFLSMMKSLNGIQRELKYD
jgi:hypothetical protein